MNIEYVYMSKNMGVTRTGSFSNDPAKWLIFSQQDQARIASNGNRPYGVNPGRIGTWTQVRQLNEDIRRKMKR